MFEKIRSIISEQLSIDDVDTITLDTSLTEDLEADSLDLFQVISEIEDAFDIQSKLKKDYLQLVILSLT